MNDAIDQLFAILREVGATPTLYGNPVTADALREAALDSVVARVTRRHASLVVPREPEWSPYL